MSDFDVESLLSEISPDAPCGEDIAYDPAYLALERLVQPGSGSGVLGDEEPAEEPNWREVREESVKLLQRSKDLRVVIFLTLASLKLEGFAGLSNGLSLLRGLLERFWDQLYPQLDPDDNNDPLERINILTALSPPSVSEQDPMKFIQRMSEVPLCSSAQMGRFSFRDVQLAKGLITLASDSEQKIPDMAVIGAAFQDTDPDQLQEAVAATQEAASHVDAITTTFAEHAYQSQSPDLSGIRSTLLNINKCIQEYLGVPVEDAGEGAPAGAAQRAAGAPGEILTPRDAVQAIQRICRYFEKNEPSSPVPLLLKRAQRLISKNFLEVMQDVCPDAMSQIELISGVSPDSAEDQYNA